MRNLVREGNNLRVQNDCLSKGKFQVVHSDEKNGVFGFVRMVQILSFSCTFSCFFGP